MKDRPRTTTARYPNAVRRKRAGASGDQTNAGQIRRARAWRPSVLSTVGSVRSGCAWLAASGRLVVVLGDVLHVLRLAVLATTGESAGVQKLAERLKC